MKRLIIYLHRNVNNSKFIKNKFPPEIRPAPPPLNNHNKPGQRCGQGRDQFLSFNSNSAPTPFDSIQIQIICFSITFLNSNSLSNRPITTPISVQNVIDQCTFKPKASLLPVVFTTCMIAIVTHGGQGMVFHYVNL